MVKYKTTKDTALTRKSNGNIKVQRVALNRDRGFFFFIGNKLHFLASTGV